VANPKDNVNYEIEFRLQVAIGIDLEEPMLSVRNISLKVIAHTHLVIR